MMPACMHESTDLVAAEEEEEEEIRARRLYDGMRWDMMNGMPVGARVGIDQ